MDERLSTENLTDHPTFHEFKLFLESSSLRKAVGRNTRVVRHLLSGCDVCRRRLDVADPDGALARQLGLRPSSKAPPSLSVSTSYEQALANAERTLSLFLSDSHAIDQPPGELLAELVLLEGDGDGPAHYYSSAKRPAIPQLITWLIGRSHTVRFEDSERMPRRCQTFLENWRSRA